MDHLTGFQIAEWEAYSKLEPIGLWVDDYKWATLMAHITNMLTWAHAKKGTKYTAEDFMPNWTGEEKPAKTQSWQEMKEFLLSFAKAHNKKIDDQEKKRSLKPKKDAS